MQHSLTKTRPDSRTILIILFAWLAYTISYLGRADYGACVLEIVNTTGVPRATAGMVSSVFSLCNAFGQIASGFLMKKYAPQKIIAAELFTVAGINLLFPMSGNFFIMAALWGVNGAMQSTLLSGATQIFVENLKEPYLSKGVVLLNTVGAIGGTINYVLTWFLIQYANWQSVFYTVSSLLFVLGIIWCILIPRITVPRKTAAAKTNPKQRLGAAELLSRLTHNGAFFAMTGCFFVGFLRESVTLWIPSYISDIFQADSGFSTILTLFVPAFQICGALLGGKIGRKIHNLHLPACVTFLCSGLSLALLLLSGSRSTLITILLFVINAICMTAALTFLLSLFPIRFLGLAEASIFVGIFNFFVHAGDFFASTGIGWLSQSTGGWTLTFGVLSTVAFFAAVLCMIGGYFCKKEQCYGA